MKGLVIIPAYKPDSNLISLAKQVQGYGNQVIIVDDGSGSEYQGVFDAAGEFGIVAHHRANRGKGAAIKTAFRYIEGQSWDCDVAGIMDADGQHLPEDMEGLLMAAKDKKGAMVLGVRETGRAMPLKSRIGNNLTKVVFRLLSGVKVSDTQTGLRAFDLALIPNMLQVEGDRYEYETNVLLSLAKEGVPLEEMGIRTIYHDSANSCSHFRAVRDSVRIYKDIFKFAICSFSSFILDYILFVLGTLIFSGLPYGILLSNAAARLLSGYYNYHINTKHVFHTDKNAKAAGQYLLLAAGILLCNNLILMFYQGAVHIPVYPAKILTELTLFVFSFLVQKNLIFKIKAQAPLMKGALSLERAGVKRLKRNGVSFSKL